jgi:hypothetical protein
MAATTGMASPAGAILFLLLLVCSAGVAPATAAGPGNLSAWREPGPDFNVTGHPFTDAGMARAVVEYPTPITIFKAEVTAETLPGPRYMGFGPSVIALSIDPRLLAVCFAVVLIGLVIWFVSFRKREENEQDDEEKE